jgi:metal-responsive CopG/Arc/MetJ family transcriptional regulator
MGREKVAITLDEGTLQDLDRLVEERFFENRSQAGSSLETLIRNRSWVSLPWNRWESWSIQPTRHSNAYRRYL